MPEKKAEGKQTVEWSISSCFINKDHYLEADHVRFLGSLGYRMLDLCAYPCAVTGTPERYSFCGEQWRPWIEEIRAAADECGIRFNQSHNVVCNFLDMRVPEEERETAARNIIEATAMLGGYLSVIHPIALPDGEYDWPRIMEANRAYFSRLGDYAAKYDVILCVENMLSNRYFDGTGFKRCCTNMEELTELVRAVGHDYVKICVDVGHAHYMGIRPGDALRQCGDLVKGLHLHDNDTWNDEHLPPFHGTIDWTDTLRALHEIGYQGELTFEIQNPFRHLPKELESPVYRLIKETGDHLVRLYQETGTGE